MALCHNQMGAALSGMLVYRGVTKGSNNALCIKKKIVMEPGMLASAANPSVSGSQVWAT